MRLVPALLVALAATLLAGCGFQLRGSTSAQLPYQSFHVALPPEAEVAIWLRRYIEASGRTRLVPDPTQAEAILQQLSENRQKTILSVDARGQVREYRLQMAYSFQIVDARSRVLVPPSEISVSRDMTYNASAVLAKEQEEASLWRDINVDVATQIMRRLSIIKPRNPDLDDEEQP